VLQVSLNQSLDTTFQRVLEATLTLEGGNRSRTARRLGISLRTVQRHLSKEPLPLRARGAGARERR
jgi:ActR/RegA family two-component response regulator